MITLISQRIQLILVFLLSALLSQSQDKNPFQSIGKKGKIVTLTNGKYEELFDQDSIQHIGTVLVNVRQMKVVKLLKDEEEAQKLLDNSANSRFLSVDPLTRSYPMLTPYAFAENDVVRSIDLDGLEKFELSSWDPGLNAVNASREERIKYAKVSGTVALKGAYKGAIAVTVIVAPQIGIPWAISDLTGVPVTPSPQAMGGSTGSRILAETETAMEEAAIASSSSKLPATANAGKTVQSKEGSITPLVNVHKQATFATGATESTTTVIEPRYVYRGLSLDDMKTMDAGKGILASSPNANNSAVSHVAGKSPSRWISTTYSEDVAKIKYGANGYVKVDLNKVPSDKVDISQGFPYMKPNATLSNWAKKDQELLIEGYIPQAAILKQ